MADLNLVCTGDKLHGPSQMRERVFLLSPAHCGGVRAQLLFRPAARFDLALRIRSSEGAALGDVFGFLSGLYFRGKLAYASAFAGGRGKALVITPSDGLVPTDRRVSLDDLGRFASVPIAATDDRYRLPLTRDSAKLRRRIGANADVVLLGSLATPKYLSVLEPIFGERLKVPSEFVGRGDMSRGSLLLRAVRAQRELDYVPASEVIRAKRIRVLK